MSVGTSSLFRSFIWKSLERFSAVGLQFVVQLILVRILSPEDYGIVAVVAAVIAILNVVIQAGVVKALVQFKNINSIYYSTAIIWNLLVASILYTGLYLLSPAIAVLTNIKEFIAISRVLGVSFFINVFISFLEAIVIRRGKYKQQFISSTLGVVVSGIVGIAFAVDGGKYWSLVVQQLSLQIVYVVALWLQIRYLPKFKPSLSRLKKMLEYSWKIGASVFIDFTFHNFQAIALGKYYTPMILGYISKGQQFPLLVVVNFDSALQPIMLRELSRYQDDKLSMLEQFRKVESISAFILFPIISMLIISAENIVVILLSERWLPSAAYLIVFSLSYMLIPFSSLNIQVMNAMGKSKLYLRNEMVKKLCGIFLLLAALPFGVMAYCIAYAFYSVISFVIDTRTTGVLIGDGFVKQISDIAPYAVLAAVAGVVVYPIRLLGLDRIITLSLSMVVTSTLYLFMCRLFKTKGYYYTQRVLRPRGVGFASNV